MIILLFSAGAALLSLIFYAQARKNPPLDEHGGHSTPTLSKLLRAVLFQYTGVRSVQRDIKMIDIVEMTTPEGEEFAMSHLYPAGMGGAKLPCILIRTPYDRFVQRFNGEIFAEAGYHVIVQDTRGLFHNRKHHSLPGKSDFGDFFPIEMEQDDGIATIKWIEQQPWFNGSIFLYGVSYQGVAAYACCQGEISKSIKGIFPVYSSSYNYPLLYPHGGILNFELALRWTFMMYCFLGTKNLLEREINRYKMEKELQHMWNDLPVLDIDKKMTKDDKGISFLRDALLHPDGKDSYWLTKKVRVCDLWNAPPTHIVSGWYDMYSHLSLRDYEEIRFVEKMREEKEGIVARSPSRLTIVHGQHFNLKAFYKHSMSEAIQWFDLHRDDHFARPLPAPSAGEEEGMNGCTMPSVFASCSTSASSSSSHPAPFNPIPPTLPRRTKPVVVEVINHRSPATQWLQFESWPPVPSDTVPYFLHPDFSLSPAPPTTSDIPPHTYTYNPADPTPSVGGTAFCGSNSGGLDQRGVEKRKDILVYTSPVLEEDLIVVGHIRCRLYVRSSLPHTDFVARLCCVHPDGKSINLCDGVCRVKPVNVSASSSTSSSSSSSSSPSSPSSSLSLDPSKPAPPSAYPSSAFTDEIDNNYASRVITRCEKGVIEIDVDMWATGAIFHKGFRVRLHVASANHPRTLRHLGVPDEEMFTTTEMHVAEQEVFMDTLYPSRLVLPVISSADADYIRM